MLWMFEQYDHTENILQTKKAEFCELLNHLSSFVKKILEFNCNSAGKIDQVKSKDAERAS